MITNFRNFKMVDYVVFGRNSFNQLGDIIKTHRKPNQPFVFLIDHFFEKNDQVQICNRLPILAHDAIIFADVTHEPKTSYVDQLANDLKQKFESISGIVGIGGGSTLDLTKAVSLMFTNPGSAVDYQGWDLVKKPGVYKVGIPTLSGTGSEVSRTTVLTGPTKKLGMNSDFTPFNQIILDPELIKNVPADQRFYTGMDCYIHCIESLEGHFLNAFSKSYGEKALAMCQNIFLHKKHWDNESDELLMMASYFGGMSIAYSQVGVAHAISYGLSYLLGTKHGIGNCIVMNHLEEYYPAAVQEFKAMLKHNHISLPQQITAHLTNADIQTMLQVSFGLKPLWENALGKEWESIMTPAKLETLYRRL
ncbi:MAG: iron-containing alcohol dehydrogenase family protein [Alphaproteobacteria bacterium]|nr:iron-containing alcohol dehydrogenase family protein [Alphaproteobacteria bacterium]